MDTRRHIQELINKSADMDALIADESRKILEGLRRDALILVTVLFLAVMTTCLRYPCIADARGSLPLPTESSLATGVDPDTAGWTELALLPGLGETVARRIVECREATRTKRIAGAANAESVTRVFTRPFDLLAVNGIGERTLRRIAPMLRFPADRANP